MENDPNDPEALLKNGLATYRDLLKNHGLDSEKAREFAAKAAEIPGFTDLAALTLATLKGMKPVPSRGPALVPDITHLVLKAMAVMREVQEWIDETADGAVMPIVNMEVTRETLELRIGHEVCWSSEDGDVPEDLTSQAVIASYRDWLSHLVCFLQSREA